MPQTDRWMSGRATSTTSAHVAKRCTTAYDAQLNRPVYVLHHSICCSVKQACLCTAPQHTMLTQTGLFMYCTTAYDAQLNRPVYVLHHSIWCSVKQACLCTAPAVWRMQIHWFAWLTIRHSKAISTSVRTSQKTTTVFNTIDKPADAICRNNPCWFSYW